MSSTEFEVTTYTFGEDVLIGKRKDGSLFWIKVEPIGDGRIKKHEFKTIEGGLAMHDEKTDTIIFGYPTKERDSLSKWEKEIVEAQNIITHYASEYHVFLSECELREPTREDQRGMYSDEDEDCYDEDNWDADNRKPDAVPEDSEECSDEVTKYVLDDYTFIQINNTTDQLDYMRFSDYTIKDIEEDRFGWVKALKRLHPNLTDQEVFDSYFCDYVKESYGKAWIEEQNGILVLGPVENQPPEGRDSFFYEQLEYYYNSYPPWDKTQHWTETDCKLKLSPLNGKMAYLSIMNRFMD